MNIDSSHGADAIFDGMKFDARDKLVRARQVAPFAAPPVSPNALVASLERLIPDANCSLNDSLSPQDSMHHRVAAFIQTLEARITSQLETLERDLTPKSAVGLLSRTASTFVRDPWRRPDSGGFGSSSVLSDGHVFDKATINTSIVTGRLPPRVVAQMRGSMTPEKLAEVEDGETMPYAACGITVVVHPKEPGVPSVQLNLRYFEAYLADHMKEGPVTAWFRYVDPRLSHSGTFLFHHR